MKRENKLVRTGIISGYGGNFKSSAKNISRLFFWQSMLWLEKTTFNCVQTCAIFIVGQKHDAEKYKCQSCPIVLSTLDNVPPNV